jgi:hypothetical protein
MFRTVYDGAFYQSQVDGSARSASVVIPIVLSLFKAVSIVDVGCGTGCWAGTFSTHGISDYVGIDGDYVDQSVLRIPPDRFHSADLRQPLKLGRRFDLACCLEVAEHLPLARAEGLVADLAALADVVLFSAAIPHQGGMDHINEQPQSYWAGLFARQGFVALDCIRPRIHGNPDVEWWYQQNILMFCRPEKCPASCVAISDAFRLDRIHPQMVQNAVDGPHSGTEAVTAIIRGTRVVGQKTLKKLTRIASA